MAASVARRTCTVGHLPDLVRTASTFITSWAMIGRSICMTIQSDSCQ
jgi:hypothetical protein